MSDKHKIAGLSAVLVAISVAIMSVCGALAIAQAAPVKLDLSDHIGWEVNKTTKTNLCTPANNDCQPATQTSQAGGFYYPESVAAIPQGLPGESNIYVSENGNHRVQELTPTGEFVEMFGKNVNGKGADTCIKAEEANCTSGEAGSEPDAITGPVSITVNPVNGNWYVSDYTNSRIDEYTPTGEFVLMIGKEVNETLDNTPGATPAEKNLCTAISKNTCKTGTRNSTDNIEHGAFNLALPAGDLLAVAGSEHLLYVGDTHRVQVFNENGEWQNEIPLPPAIIESNQEGHITSMAVGNNTIYIDYNLLPTVTEYNVTTGAELATRIEIPPRETGNPVRISALALDPQGHLAIWSSEAVVAGPFTDTVQYGTLYDAANGQLLTEFTTPGQRSPLESSDASDAIAFDGNGKLYAIIEGSADELWGYVPVSVAEVVTGSSACSQASTTGTSVTMSCALHGSVNPYSIAETEAWFRWGKETAGRCDLLSTTTHQSLPTEEAILAVSATIEGLRPNQKYCYELAGNDENVKLPEKLDALSASGVTQSVAPIIIGSPTAAFVKPASALLFGELNPENTNTEYFFEYTNSGLLSSVCPKGVQAEQCLDVASTTTLSSAIYGEIVAPIEVSNLQPETTYHVRLAAKNGVANTIGKEETAFTTSSIPPPPPSPPPPPPPSPGAPLLQAPPAVAQLPSPPLAFPQEEPTPSTCRRGYVGNDHDQCVKIKVKKRKKGRKGKKGSKR